MGRLKPSHRSRPPSWLHVSCLLGRQVDIFHEGDGVRIGEFRRHGFVACSDEDVLFCSRNNDTNGGSSGQKKPLGGSEKQ